MHLFPILLVAALMAVDGGLRPIAAAWDLSNSLVTWLACGPIVAALLAMWIGIAWCDRLLERGRVNALITADRIGRAVRVSIIANHLIATLVFGWLGAVRSVTGDWLLLDELIALAPALAGLLAIWWIYYPIERRLHQATLIRQLDEGRPVYAEPSRGGYVVLQARIHLLLTLVPVLLIALASEAISESEESRRLPAHWEWLSAVGKIAAAAVVFMLAPLLARFMLDVTPLTDGPLRQSLLEVCIRNKVRIRELLVWNTNGTVFNAAVMGLVGRLRYVMITDALLETMDADHVRAVMAHEIGHVRRHHLPWLAVCLMACFAFVQYATEIPAWSVFGDAPWLDHQATRDGISIGMSGLQLIGGFVLFGWVCRRFERQADTFAVQHLSVQSPALIHPQSDPGETASAFEIPRQASNGNAADATITPHAVHIMCSALDAIARLNLMDPDRPSWRHGSIAWRMEYLRSIIGLPAGKLPIDRKVRWLKMAAAAMVLLACGHLLFHYLRWGITP